MIKLTLELKVDEEIGGPPDAMQQVVRKLDELRDLPVNGLKIVFVAADESGAERIEEELDELLADRAYRVIATIDRKYDKRDLMRRKLEPGPSPIERAISGADAIGDFAGRHGVERVTLSARGRTVELTPAARRNAERALRNIGKGDDSDGE